MPLSPDANKYCDELFRASETRLRKELETRRSVVRQNLVDLEVAARRAGYPGVLQPEIDFNVGLSMSKKDAMCRAYAWDGQDLTEDIVAEIEAEATTLLQQSCAGFVNGEKGRLAMLAQRTRQSDATTSARLAELSRHVQRTICDAQIAMHNDLTLRMLEAKKASLKRSPSMNVAELRARVEHFRSHLDQHFKLWVRSLDQTLPDRPLTNIEELERQRSALARQLGALRPYFDWLGLHTMAEHAYGPPWDIFTSAVSNDVAIRKGESIEAILPQLEQALGRLEGLNPNSEVEMQKPDRPSPTQHVTIHQHGPQSRVNLNSTDNSTNTLLSQTDQNIFTQVRTALQQVPDGQRADILAKLADFESAAHHEGSHRKFKAFIESAKDFMSILGPFIPMLTEMLK